MSCQDQRLLHLAVVSSSLISRALEEVLGLATLNLPTYLDIHFRDKLCLYSFKTGITDPFNNFIFEGFFFLISVVERLLEKCI